MHSPLVVDEGRTAILRSCTILFVFRALATAQNESAQCLLEAQLVDLINDFVGSDKGAVVLGRPPSELRSAVLGRSEIGFDFQQIADRLYIDGVFLEEASGTLAVPIPLHGQIAGIIVVQFASGTQRSLDEKRETLSGIATLASFALKSAQEIEELQAHNLLLREELASAVPGIIGQSPVMQRLLQTVKRVARQDATVLITGASGTGKELIARLLHDKNPRCLKPFVAINCASLNEHLLESELFGHEKGAFTGAIAQKKGKLELAEGGTVFLDEIGELAPSLQAKLLRVLQQREFERVGGTRTVRLDIRLIAATNRDLAADVQRGVFRDDLYHRLNVIALQVPALRERPSDIMPLATYFLQRSTAKCGRRMSGISSEAEQCLVRYSWPGNVRELENVIERAVILGDSELLMPEDLPDPVRGLGRNAGSVGVLDMVVSESKRESILRAWEESAGDYKRAAALLSLHPNSLLRLIRKLSLRDMLHHT